MPAVSGSGLVHSTRGRVGPVLGAPCTRPDVQTAGHPPPRGEMRFWASPHPTQPSSLRWRQAQHPWSQPPSSTHNQVPRSPSPCGGDRPQRRQEAQALLGVQAVPSPSRGPRVGVPARLPTSAQAKPTLPPGERPSRPRPSQMPCPKAGRSEKALNPGVTFDFMGPRFSL